MLPKYGQGGEKQDEADIYLLEALCFLKKAWKKLLIAAVVGGIIGLCAWFMLANHLAEITLTNKNEGGYGLNYASWSLLEKKLPKLMRKIDQENKIPDGYEHVYRTMSKDSWWKKNVAAIYALSQTEAKGLINLSKDAEANLNTIVSFNFNFEGSSKELAAANVIACAQFFITGSEYLELLSFLADYEGQMKYGVSQLQQEITDNLIAINNKKERLLQLEELYKRFPGKESSASFYQGSKDDISNFLSIQTQIIAATNDLNASKAVLVKLTKRKDQFAIIKKFVDQAQPLINKTFNGKILAKQFFDIESGIRGNLSKDDLNNIQVLDNIHTQLTKIDYRFNFNMDEIVPLVLHRESSGRYIGGGFALGFFIMLLALLNRRYRVKVSPPVPIRY